MVMPISDSISILEHGRIKWSGNVSELENNDSLRNSYLGL